MAGRSFAYIGGGGGAVPIKAIIGVAFFTFSPSMLYCLQCKACWVTAQGFWQAANQFYALENMNKII